MTGTGDPLRRELAVAVTKAGERGMVRRSPDLIGMQVRVPRAAPGGLFASKGIHADSNCPGVPVPEARAIITAEAAP